MGQSSTIIGARYLSPANKYIFSLLLCSLLKSCSDVFAPVVAELANLSMQTGKFPTSHKQAQMMPLLKKAGLDSSSPDNIQAHLQPQTVSKVLERLVLTRLHPHLLGSANFSEYQSACRKGHSTETALLEVLDGVYTAADSKQVTVLNAWTCRRRLIQSTTRSCFSGCSPSLA